MRIDASGKLGASRLILAALLAAAVVLSSSPGRADTGLKPLPQPADFRQLVEWGLAHSPFFTDSALGIEAGKLGETDAQLSYIPQLTIHLRYYLTSTVETRQYNLVFQSTGVNPLKAYFSVEAAKDVTKLAVQEHLEQVENNIQIIAEAILTLHGLEKVIKIKTMDLDLAKQRVKYAKAARQDTPAALIETQVAEQEVVVTSNELEKLRLSRQEYLDSIKVLLNLPVDSTLQLDLEKARKQILEGFQPSKVTSKDFLDHSYDVKKAEIKSRLQTKRISLAWSKYMPELYLGVATEDPLYETSRDNDWYLYLGLSTTLWDNMERARDVSRQRLKARESRTDLKSRKAQVARDWRKTMTDVRLSQADLMVAHEQAKLESFKEKQNLAQFRTNQITYGILAEQSSKYLQARIKEVYQEGEYERVKLKMALGSGWMLDRFVSGTSF